MQPVGIMDEAGQDILWGRLKNTPRNYERSSVLRAMAECLGNAGCGMDALTPPHRPDLAGIVLLGDEKGAICEVALVSGQFQLTCFWGFVPQPRAQIVPCGRLREALAHLKNHPARPDYRTPVRS